MAQKLRGGDEGRLRDLRDVDRRLRTGGASGLIEGIRGKIRTKETLSTPESLLCLLAGNRIFSEEKGGLESNGRGKILPIDVAGNIITPDDPVFKDLLVSAAKGMKESRTGMLLNVGHVHCGAVNAAIDFENGDYDPETKNIRFVVDHVQGKNEIDNSLKQASAAGELIVETTGITFGMTALYFDWEKRELINIGESTDHRIDNTEIVDDIQASARKIASIGFFGGAMEAEQMAPQYAHAIVVSDPKTIMGKTPIEAIAVRCADARGTFLAPGDSFSDPRTLFSAGPQEIFLVSSNEGLVPQAGIGSIEYALLHVKGTKHIVIIDTDEKVAVDTRDFLVDSSETVWRKLTKGDLDVTLLQYDPKTGAANIIFE